ncbi:IS66 family transposase [Photobacterium japonica]
MNKAAAKLLPLSPMGKTVSYALKQWVYLEKYVDDGKYPIDNNRVERDIRPVATDVDPYAYRRHVLTVLPQREAGCDASDLLPYSNTPVQ